MYARCQVVEAPVATSRIHTILTKLIGAIVGVERFFSGVIRLSLFIMCLYTNIFENNIEYNSVDES